MYCLKIEQEIFIWNRALGSHALIQQPEIKKTSSIGVNVQWTHLFFSLNWVKPRLKIKKRNNFLVFLSSSTNLVTYTLGAGWKRVVPKDPVIKRENPISSSWDLPRLQNLISWRKTRRSQKWKDPAPTLIFTGRRCRWGPVYVSRCLYLPPRPFETLLMWLWLMMIPTQY